MGEARELRSKTDHIEPEDVGWMYKAVARRSWDLRG
jgi:hypothetical protein